MQKGLISRSLLSIQIFYQTNYHSISLITHEIRENQFSRVHSLSMSTKINNIFYSILHHKIV